MGLDYRDIHVDFFMLSILATFRLVVKERPRAHGPFEAEEKRKRVLLADF